MANFLELNGVNVPVAGDEWEMSPAYGSEPFERRHDAAGSVHTRYQKPVWEGKTPILTPTDTRTLVGFISGDFDVYTYEDALMKSARGKIPTVATRDTAAPKFGAANGAVASAGTAVFPGGVSAVQHFALLTYKKDTTGDYTAWTHVGYRGSDLATWESGALAGTAGNWLTLAAPNVSLLGKNSAGTNDAAKYDNTVICWFNPTTVMMETWSAANYEWPSVAPFLQMTGSGASFRGRSQHKVRGVVKRVKYVQALINGLWYDSAGVISFALYGS